MPLYYGICKKCNVRVKILTLNLDWDNLPLKKKTCKCGLELERDAVGVSFGVKEVLDNGCMPKAVERYANIEELQKERLSKADPNAGKSNRH